jgi:sec-independent protein translocase protein TatA
MLPNIGPTELIIILVIVLIIFGVGRLPEIGGAIGKSIREFRDASKEPGKEAKKEEKPKEQAEQTEETKA